MWALESLEASSLTSQEADTGCQLEHLHIAPPCGLCMSYSGPPHSIVSGFQETVPQESRANTHGIFMVLPQMSDSVTNFCQALLGETITKVCPGSRGGMCGEDSQGHGVR